MWASALRAVGAPPGSSSPSGAVGKSNAYYCAPTGARRGPWQCIGCKKPITYGDRCPPCEQAVRTRAAKRRRRR